MIIVLIAFCHTLNIQYSAEIREPLEILQEKLLGLVEGKKKSTAYLNVSRSIYCIQCKLEKSSQSEIQPHMSQDSEVDLDETFYHDDFETQTVCEWETF